MLDDMRITDTQTIAMQLVSSRQWWLWAIISGISTWLSYGLAAFAPLPDALGRLIAFAFGPLLMIFSYCFFQLLRTTANSIVLHIALIFNLVATALLTLMLIVQQASFAFHAQFLEADRGSVSQEQLEWIFNEVNAIQLGIDLAWDLFISAGTVLFSLSMWRHKGFGRLLPLLGIVSGLLLFIFNMIYFPQPPADAGSIDMGPFVALWYLLLTLWIAWRPGIFHVSQ